MSSMCDLVSNHFRTKPKVDRLVPAQQPCFISAQAQANPRAQLLTNNEKNIVRPDRTRYFCPCNYGTARRPAISTAGVAVASDGGGPRLTKQVRL